MITQSFVPAPESYRPSGPCSYCRVVLGPRWREGIWGFRLWGSQGPLFQPPFPSSALPRWDILKLFTPKRKKMLFLDTFYE